MPDNNFVVKISVNQSVGSGFVYCPKGAPDRAYVFTARHVLVGDDHNDILVKEDISIDFLVNTKSNYKVTSQVQVLLGSNNYSEDIALIIIPAVEILDILKDLNIPLLFEITGKEDKCQIHGFPKAAQNNFRRTLYECTFVSDKDYPQQFQIAFTDSIKDLHNVNDLLEGYSGAPIKCQVDQINYVCGVFHAFEPNMTRIKGINFSTIQTLLLQQGLPKLEFTQFEPDAQILKDIQKISGNTLRVLDRIKNNIGQINLDRRQVQGILKSTIVSSSLIVVSGKAGIGKSSLVKQVLNDIKDQYEIIALQGEQLDKASITEVFNGPAFSLESNFIKILTSSGLKPQKILLIDSIEKLLETKNAETIVDFLSLLKDNPTVKIVLTCRSYAVEHLKVRFFYQFPEFKAFEVPLLDDQELEEVAMIYPNIRPLFSKESLKRILQVPFNLDKAIFVEPGNLSGVLDSEYAFKGLMWEYVIESLSREIDPSKRKQRADIFSEIALERARQMVPYVSISQNSEQILIDLKRDNIIDVDIVAGNLYAPAHDIFEDWALTRYIQKIYSTEYQNSTQPIKFFETITAAPALRRAFRIWIAEQVQLAEPHINLFVEWTLSNTAVEVFWKDEVLTAIMQSPYSKEFLASNKSFLFANDHYWFKRCTLLLKVACQSPDFSLSGLYKDKKEEDYLRYILKPYGPGWSNMIDFIHSNIGELNELFYIVVPILFEWESILTPHEELPKESREVGEILLCYLKYCKEDYRESVNRRLNDKYIEKAIKLLFRLTKVINVEVATLLEESLLIKEDRNKRNYSRFHDKLIEYAISWKDSASLSQQLPDLVIKICRREWFYFPPTQEEMDYLDSISPFKSMLYTQISSEQQFGVTDGARRDYFPASVYQTPISHLLMVAPNEALQFIIELFNHSVNAFLDSNFLKDNMILGPDERFNLEIKLPDGKVIKQHGSRALWSMYRGLYVATPYLLQSVLMALEHWLLLISGIIEKDNDNKFLKLKERLTSSFDFILTNSQNVATTAVLASVITAYPRVFGDRALTILRVKEFYLWDLLRCSDEGRALSPYSQSNPLIQDERYKSNNLPHRKEHLESLMLKLGFWSLKEDIFKIIDDFQSENPSEQDWRFSLNRMDARKLKILETTSEGFLMQSVIDEDLKPTAEETIKEQEMLTPIRKAAHWASLRLDNKPVDNDSFEEWVNHFKSASSVKPDLAFGRVWNQPITLAAVGLRDFYPQMDTTQKEWCLNQVVSGIEYEIKTQNDFDSPSTYSAFDIEPAFQSLSLVIQLSNGGLKTKAKELLFLSLLFVSNDLHREAFVKSIRKTLWDIDREFAMACVSGLIEYSKISNLRFRINHFHHKTYQNPKNSLPSIWISITTYLKKLLGLKKDRIQFGEQEQKDLIHEYEFKLTGIVKDVIANTMAKPQDWSQDDFESSWIIFQAVFIIPYNNSDPLLNKFILSVLNFTLTDLAKEDSHHNEKIPFELRQKFEKYFASYLLHQKKDTAIESFQHLVDWVFKDDASIKSYRDNRIELIEYCLTSILYRVDENKSLVDNFWLFWEYLFQKVKESGISYFTEHILLNSLLWGPASESWHPIEGHKHFFKESISLINDTKSTVKLLSGIGFTELLPEGISWLAEILKLEGENFEDEHAFFYGEKLISKTFYNPVLRTTIKNNKQLRDHYLLVLDKLIDKSSAVSFLIRDDFISLS